MKKLLAVLLILALLFCGCDAGYNRYSAGASGFDEEIALCLHSESGQFKNAARTVLMQITKGLQLDLAVCLH